MAFFLLLGTICHGLRFDKLQTKFIMRSRIFRWDDVHLEEDSCAHIGSVRTKSFALLLRIIYDIVLITWAMGNSRECQGEELPKQWLGSPE